MRIRQIALVAADLDTALAELCEALAIDVSFHDPGVEMFGLRNGVMPIGEQFLEVVSPEKEGTSAGRYLERRGGDGGYMVIFQTRDLAARKQHFARLGIRSVWGVTLDDIETTHLHPSDTGGAIVSLDEARPWESWRWAGPKWRDHVRTERVSAISSVEIQSPDPEALARRWEQIFELARTSATVLTLDDGSTIRFCTATDGRGEGIRSISLRASDACAIRDAASALGRPAEADGAVVLAGVRFLVE